MGPDDLPHPLPMYVYPNVRFHAHEAGPPGCVCIRGNSNAPFQNSFPPSKPLNNAQLAKDNRKLKATAMKKWYMPLAFTVGLLTILLEQTNAQTYSEIEPNNSFASATLLKRYPDTLGGVINNADGIDYFRFDMTYYQNTLQFRVGTLVAYFVITNNGSPSDVFTAQIYNGLQGGGISSTENFTGIATGQTVTRSISLCGAAMDDYYLSVSSSGNFTYKMVWYYSDGNQNIEPNDTRATAAVLSYTTLGEYRQGIQYRYRNDPNTDTVDYFRVSLPAGSYDNVFLNITAKNNSCLTGQWIQYAVFKNAETTPFETGYVGGSPSIPQYTEAASAVSLAAMNPGDMLYIKIWSLVPFGYKLDFKQEEVTFEDEINDFDYEGYSALNLGQNVSQVAQVGYHVSDGTDLLYDDDGNPIIDNYDAYAITVPADGELIFTVSARNDECGYGLYYDILDEWGSSISNQDYKEIITWNGECFTTKSAIIRIPAVIAGNYIIRIHNGNSGTPERVSYSFKYQVTPYNSGGAADPEPDYNQSMAKPIVVSQVNKGYLRFISESLDEADYYRTTMPAEGTITVYMKATYRGETKSATIYNALTFYNFNTNYTRRIPLNRGISTLVKNTVYYDTLTIPAVPQGTANFLMYSDEPYEYEFRYEIEDVITGPNDAEPNNSFATAQPLQASDTTYGRVGYVVNGQLDQYDYFRAAIPTDATVKIYIRATNNDEAAQIGFDWLEFYAFDGRGSGGSVFNKRITNNDNIPLGATVYDTVTICGYAADSIFFRFSAYQKFAYQFRMEVVNPTVNNSTEPDGTFATAHKLVANQTYTGTIGYERRNVTDGADFYKASFGSKDTLRLAVKATNYGCAPTGLRIRVYNKQQAQIFTRFINNNAAVAIGAEVTENISIPVTAPDTIFIRFESNTAFAYEFTTGPLVPSSFYSLSGDTTACTGTQIYRAHNITDQNITYNWSLPLGGGTINYTDSTATVVWTQSAIRKVRLVLSNSAGSSEARELTVVVNDNAPTQVPVAYNFARTLSTNSLPLGATVQWFKNGVAIAGATDTTYYAADAGTFTVSFMNDCGAGPASNGISFPNPVLPQSITVNPLGTLTMSPSLRVALNASTNSGMRIFYQRISGPGAIVNDSLDVTGAGTIIVRAYQPGDDVYSAAADKFDTIIVAKGTQSISFDSIPNKIFSDPAFVLGAASSSGLNVSYTIVTSNAAFSGGKLHLRGAGTVTVRASQAGSSNYLAAAPVDRTFCVGVRTLSPITGDPSPCTATYKYLAQNIPGANYVWSISGGGILTTHNDTAWVQWQTLGSHTISVKVNSSCDTIYSETRSFVATVSNTAPAPVSGMKPDNLATNQQLPLTLSWIPGPATVNYDLYLWDSTATEPVTPFAANLTKVWYVVPNNTLAYNKTYKWKVVSKNPCTQTAGPVQQFRIIPLPDLVVSDVQAPATINSGETITVSWKVTNIGPGRTFLSDTWSDGVYFSLDTFPNFRNDPSWNAWSWNTLTAQGRPLLLGRKLRPAALDSGEFYRNSLSFTLPNEYSFPVYVYVITDNGHPNYRILQASVANDTSRKQNAVAINLSPTPDLRVDTVFTPLSAFSGSTINVSYRVKNYGVVTPAGNGWTDSLFISQNPLFDRNQAIPLTLPKANGSYYPNAVKAHVNDNVQMNADEVRTQSVQAVIPNFISGTWFVYVKTNANKNTALYEGALNENNVNRAQIQIYLAPTPKLTVNNLSIPSTVASTTQKIGLNYSVKNDGFTDNWERSKGHFLFNVIGRCPCNISVRPNEVCQGPPMFRDSFLLGSSYWVDKIYLSADPNGLNTSNAILLREIAHGTKFSALLFADDMTGECSSGGKFNVSHALNPGAEFPKDTSFQVPADLPPGNYYVYVHTNANRDVFEYPGTPQITRSTSPIVVSRPDIHIPSISVAANTSGGQLVTVNYSISNIGAGSVYNYLRRDQLYISNFPNFDGTATLLQTKSITENIPSGATLPQSFSYRLPPATTGAKYFFVVSNYDSSFRETTYSNNRSVSAGTMVVAAQPSDLIVSGVQAPDSVFTIYSNRVSYTVSNNGTGSTAGSWKDSLFVSCSPVFNRATSVFVATRSQSRSTEAGSNYSDTFSFTMPKMSYEYLACFPQTGSATAYFFVKTNADTGTYEASSVANNMSAAIQKILVNPLVDHIITSVNSSTDTVTVGRTMPLQWTLKNVGYKPSYGYYKSYYDGVYLSADVNLQNTDPVVGTFLKYGLLNRGDSATDHKQLTIPDVPTGNYYLFVKSNINNGIEAEKVINNNSNLLRNGDGTPKLIHVIRPLLPDLTDSIVSAPSSVVAGQPLTVIRRTYNRGVGVTYPGTWSNDLRLSVDFIAQNNDGDRLLSQKTRTGTLLPGEFRDDTVTVSIPLRTVPGNYVLISEADPTDKMVESNEINNLGFHLLTVLEPPVVDLRVTQVTAPDSVYLGNMIDTVKWRTYNASPNEAKGKISEAVYLSKNEAFDSTAILLGIRTANIDLDPLQDSGAILRPVVTGVTEGVYRVFVKTDLLDNFLEENEDNNNTFAAGTMFVKVRELPLNITEQTTLQQTSSRYYKLIIPDSLIGSTIRVTLTSNDSLLYRNEMFIAGGYVPSGSKHDYKFEVPNYGNQSIVIADVSQPIYYIEIRSASPNAGVQQVQLKAVKLPFSILSVQTNSGGNSGNVTVKINGSLFTPGMTPQLVNENATIIATRVYFVNSTQVFATFGLKGRPLGVYDLVLKKGDTATAVLPSGFTIVPTDNGGLITGSGPNNGGGNGNEPGCDPGAASGLNSQLVVELNVPPTVLVRRPIMLTLNFRNPTNVDISTQTRVLYTEELKLALTKEGVPTGTTALYLEIAEQGGPPGIIRAGGSGTIIIYSQAPRNVPNNPVQTFKLK